MPLQFAHQRHQVDTEDLALTFMEEEIGRFHWKENWAKFKNRFSTPEALRHRVNEWLDRIHVDHDPSEIIAYLDEAVAKRDGRWQ